MEAEDSNGVRLNLWLWKDDEYHEYCKQCRCQVKYNTQGTQAFTYHSQKKKLEDISDIRFSTSQVCISGKAESSTSLVMKKSTSKNMILDASQKNKISSAEAMWMSKVAEQDYSLRSCDDVPKLFQTCSVTAILQISQDKKHHILSLMGLDLSLERGCVMILQHLRDIHSYV